MAQATTTATTPISNYRNQRNRTPVDPRVTERLTNLQAEREKRLAESNTGTVPSQPTTNAHARLSGRLLASAQSRPQFVQQSPSHTNTGGTAATPATPSTPTNTTTTDARRVVGTGGARIPVNRTAGHGTAGTNAATGTAHNTGTTTPNTGTSGAATSSTTAGAETRPVAHRKLPDGTVVTTPTTVSRRPSKLVIDKERKTDYWKDVEKKAEEQGAKLNSDDLNSVIARAMSLGVVGDKKQRESFSGPESSELLQHLKSSMERRLVELNGGRQINFESLIPSGSASMMEKILSLERALSTLETKKSKEEEEEKKRVQNKITELEKSLKSLEVQKQQQREQNRRTMKLEIANLKEMMEKVQKDKTNETQAASEAKALAAKMSRLEAALRLMNEDRKKGQMDDKDTLLLKRKLALFEQKLQEMEDEKKMREAQDQSGALRDKLLLMESKLAKMEKRKSVTLTLQMQQKMEDVEKQLAILRNERNVGHNEPTNTKIAQKMAILEKQLQNMAQQKFTPAMIQDEETVALRDHITKLEEQVILQEKRMDEQRQKLEDDRKRNYEKRIAEEEAFRQQAKAKEEELINRIALMESKLKAGFGGGSGINPELLERLKKLEQSGAGGTENFTSKIQEMEKKLEETQKQLLEEKKMTENFFTSKTGPELEQWQTGAQLAWLTKSHEELVRKIETANKEIEEKMKELDKKLKEGVVMGPGGGAAVSKSGLSYADINAKLQELQSKLFNPDTDPREAENLNIEYEKLITELEQTPEYQKEQEQTREKWKKENEAPNKEAFDKVFTSLKAMPDAKITAVFKRKPELRFILRTSEQLLKAHVNDFKQVSTQNLLLIEARALYHIMPTFRKDQEQQIQFVQQLQQKIELEAAKAPTPAPPPIKATKKIVIKTKKGGGGGGGSDGFLNELLEKRKRKE